MGSSFIFDPVYMNVSVPGKAIKKPKTAEEHFDQCLRKWGGNGKR